MANFELEGVVEMVSDVIQITETFRKRELVVEYISYKPEYPEFVKFEQAQDRVEMFDGLQKGDRVKVMFNVKGKRNQKQGTVRYFVSLQPWRVEKLGGGAPAVQGQGAPVEDGMPF